MSKGDRKRAARRLERERLEAGEVAQDMSVHPMRTPNRYLSRSKYNPRSIAQNKRNKADGQDV